MAWTSKQKQLAVRACRAAGLSEEQRVDMILRNFQHAHYNGDITSTSPKLTHHDYECFMAIVEKFAGGTILHFTEGYWTRCAADGLCRMRLKALAIAADLEAAAIFPPGTGLAGWIEKRVAKGGARDVSQLDYHGLLALILQLSAFARQRGVSKKQESIAVG